MKNLTSRTSATYIYMYVIAAAVILLLLPRTGEAAYYDCTGGTITHASGYTIHTFTTTGASTLTCTTNLTAEVLVVGGGGPGGHGAVGYGRAGGGGGGGVIYNSAYALTATSYSISVGTGGSVSYFNGLAGCRADNGGPGANGDSGGTNGSVGGSGGGGAGSAYFTNTGGAATQPSSSYNCGGTGYGNSGGPGVYTGGFSGGNGGGGGGAGAASTNTTGGAGVYIASFGAYYGGGGGGGAGGSVGNGGGGTGGIGSNGNNGTANTGGGGGGGDEGYNGGTGGSGIVIVRYPTPNAAPPISTPSSPANGSTQNGNGANITFTTNSVVDLDGDSVQYYFRVATGADGETGVVCNSGWQAGTTYSCNPGAGTFYWHVYTYDGKGVTSPNYTWSFTNNYAPTTGTVSPSSGSYKAGAQTFTSTYTDQNGASSLSTVYFLINSAVDGNNVASYAYYDRAAGTCYLYNSDNAGGWAAGGWQAAPATLPWVTLNSCSGSAVGNTLTVTWNLTFNTWNEAVNEYLYAADSALNSGWSASKGSINVDTTAPTTAGAITGGTAGSNGWYTSNVTYTLSTADNLSGIASTVYCTDTTNTCSPATSGTSVTVSTESATNYVRWKSTDNAGNVQTVQSSGAIKIDKSAPGTSGSVTGGSAGTNGWYTSDVTYSLSTIDVLSGIASTVYCTDTTNTCNPVTSGTAVTVSTESATNYVRWKSTDNAGNVQTVQSSGAIKIDKTAPTVPTPSDDGDYVSTTTLTFTGAPSDALAGLSSCSAQVDVGDTDGLSLAMGTTSVGTDGDHTFTGENDGTYYYRYSCTDAAGNGSSYSSWSDGVTVSIHSLSLVSNGGTLGGTAAGQKDYGTAITITQTPPSGYTFGGWSSTNDVCTGIGDCSFSMPAFDVTVTATYTGLPFFTSADDQTFTSGQSAAGISTITITDPAGDISASTDIRIAIATSSVDMRFDSSDTSATFGGTASDKVSNPVSYEGDDSVLVISVDVNFLAGDTLTVSGLSFTSFGTANSATTALSMLIHGSGSTTAGYDAKKVTIEGGLTFGAHSEGQVSDQFSTGSITDEPLFAFSLAPHGESIEVESLAFELSSVKGVGENDITNVGLYRDNDSDRTHSGPDAAVGGAPTVSVENGAGAISFGEPFTATTTNDYILTGSVANLSGSDRLYVAMNTGDVTAVGAVSGAVDKSGSAPGVLHALARVGAVGGGGGATALGENFTPVVATTTSGGSDGGSGGAIDPNSGTTIGSEAGYFPPAGNGTPHNGWTAGGNAYASDGSYVTTSGSGVQQSYGTFNFTVPQNDAMTGIGVKLEASGSSASGTIGVKLSWDGGSSWTFEKTTSVLTQLDAVYTVGGQGDTWSRSWSPSETTNGNLLVDVIAHPGNNTISLDAIQVNVYHQATGGGQGGGGAVFGNETRFFANAYEAFTSAFGLRVETFVNWLFGFAHGF